MKNISNIVTRTLSGFLKQSISTQLLLLLSVGITVQITVLQVFMRDQLVSTQVDNKVNSIKENFIVAHDAIEYLMLDEHFEEVRKLLGILNTSMDVLLVLVQDENGEIVVSTDAKYQDFNIKDVVDDYQLQQFESLLFPSEHQGKALIQKLCKNTDYLVFSAPIQFSRLDNPDSHLHDLVLLANLKDSKQQILWSSYSTFFIQILAMIAVTMLLLLFFHRAIQDRLVKVTSELRRFAQGDTDLPTRLQGRDELAQLSRESNTLIEELKSRRNQVLRQKEYFQSVFENMAHSAVIVEEDGTIVQCNHAAKKYLREYHMTDQVDGTHFNTCFKISASKELDNLYRPEKSHRSLSFKSFLLLAGQWHRVDIRSNEIVHQQAHHNRKIIIISDEHIQYELQSRIVENENRLSSILENVPGLVFVFHPDDEMQFINRRTRDYFDLDQESYFYADFVSALPQELRKHLDQKSNDVLNGEVFKREACCFKHDEVQACFSITLFPVVIHVSDKSLIACVMLDVTREVNNEHKLKASQQHLNDLACYSPFAIVEWSYMFEVTFWNSAAEKLFEINASEAIGQSLLQLVADNKNMELLSGHLEKTRVNRYSYSKTISFQAVHGEKKHTEWSSFAIPVTTLTEPRFVSMVLDVTQVTDMVHDLILKDAEKEEVLESMVEPVITIDEHGKILTFNHAAEIVFGYSCGEIKGANVKRLMPPDIAQQHDHYLGNHLRTGERKIIGIGREVTGLKKSGEQFPMHLSVSELPIKPGGVRRFIGNCIDLSNIKEKERQLSRSMKMDALGKLTGGIAHDFNNLLGIMMGYCELLCMDDELPEKHVKSLYEVKKAGLRATNLTSKLLNFSKQKAQQISPVNLSNVIFENQIILEKSLRPGIDLCFDLHDDLWLTNIDSCDFEDALLNLVINAVHALENNGEIWVKTYNCGEKHHKECGCFHQCVICEVTDNGPGIPEDIQDKIFDPFFSTKGEKGTGLGLSQVYGFVNRSGGDVNLSSSPKGTMIQIVLPSCDKAAPIKPTIPEVRSIASYHKGRILVVDDEVTLTEIVKTILSRAGYTVDATSESVNAQQMLSTQQYDLLVTDVVMPAVDGIELVAYSRKVSPDTRILMMSGYLDYQQTTDLEPELFDKLIKKPFSPSQIIEAVVSELA